LAVAVLANPDPLRAYCLGKALLAVALAVAQTVLLMSVPVALSAIFALVVRLCFVLVAAASASMSASLVPSASVLAKARQDLQKARM
jgi:hypothetical protein